MKRTIIFSVDALHQKKKMLSLIGIGSSRRRDVSERHEELLWRKATKENRS